MRITANETWLVWWNPFETNRFKYRIVVEEGFKTVVYSGGTNFRKTRDEKVAAILEKLSKPGANLESGWDDNNECL